jgi:xylulokinase
LYKNDGSAGAAIGAGIGAGTSSFDDAFKSLQPEEIITPNHDRYEEPYGKWLSLLKKFI